MDRARLVFEDGKWFEGRAFAPAGDRYAEAVFHTAMTGYQEVLTDPSYSGQMIVMTYPLIGSYGINDEDTESVKVHPEAFIVKEYIDFPSNYRSSKTLKAYLEEQQIFGAEGFDTRAVTRYLRQFGAKKALLTSSDRPIEELVDRVRRSENIVGQNIVKYVTDRKGYQWPRPDQARFRVAVIDCGVKHNILRRLAAVGCECVVFPANVHPDRILNGSFDGVFFSNGPGDPEPVVNVYELIKDLLGKLPFFGICLGHQLLGLALGARIFKLPFGHHGANHPIKNYRTGRIEITSQNHNYAVAPDSLDTDLVEITHTNLNDGTVAGLRHKTLPAFSVQYHPEASPGPHDSRYLFDEFIEMMQTHKTQAA